MYRGWTQTDYQNKHYNINQKDEGIFDDRGRDGGTNFILRIKEKGTHLTLQEHDDDDDDDDDDSVFLKGVAVNIAVTLNMKSCSLKKKEPFFPGKKPLGFYIRNSQNVRSYQYNVFRPMFVQEKVILTFQKVNVTFLTKRRVAYRLYVLLHTECLLTSTLIVW